MSVVSSITITPPEPSMLPIFATRVVIHGRSHSSARSTGQDDPPGTTAFSFLAVPNAAADFVDHPQEIEAHRQLVHAGLVHVTRQAEQARAAVLWRAEIGEPLPAVQNDRRDRAECLDVVEDGRGLPCAGNGRKRRPDSRNSALAFERFEQRRFFAALVRARAA